MLVMHSDVHSVHVVYKYKRSYFICLQYLISCRINGVPIYVHMHDKWLLGLTTVKTDEAAVFMQLAKIGRGSSFIITVATNLPIHVLDIVEVNRCIADWSEFSVFNGSICGNNLLSLPV